MIAPSPSAATLGSGIPINPGTRTFSPQWCVRSLCLGQKGPSGTSRQTRISHGRWPGPPRSWGRSWLLCGGVLASVVLAGSSQCSGASPEGQVGAVTRCAVGLGRSGAHLPRLPPGWSCPPAPAPHSRPVTACFWPGACSTPCPGAVTSTPSPSLARQVPGPASPASTPNPEPQAHPDGGRPGAVLPRQAPRHSCPRVCRCFASLSPDLPATKVGSDCLGPRASEWPLQKALGCTAHELLPGGF